MSSLFGQIHRDGRIEGFRHEEPFAILFDGRLDNRDELIAILGQPPTRSDEALVAAAFRHWGWETPGHLLGDFAFAIWDRVKQELFLARDPFGVKPLYFYSHPQKFIFGSKIALLFKDSAVPKKPNEAVILGYLTGEFCDAGMTYFEGISQLPPAHYLCLKKDGAYHISKYWDANPKQSLHYASADQYHEHYRELFGRAVSTRLRSTAPVGFFLSGGLDSMQVVAMAETLRKKEKQDRRFEAVTLIEKGFWQEELDSLELLKETYGTPIHTMRLWEMAHVKSCFEVTLDHGETPHPDGLPILPPLLAYLQSKGCHAVLTGYGASEYCNAYEYGYLQDLLISGRLFKLSSELNRVTWATRSNRRVTGLKLIHHTLREIFSPAFFRSFRKWFGAPSYLSQVLRKEIPPPRLKPRLFPTLCQEQMYRAVTRPSMAFALNQMGEAADRYSMELRHPFLDRRLIEFLLAVPSEVKMAGGYRKMFLQSSLEGIVPGPVRRQESERCIIEEDLAGFFKMQAERIAFNLQGADTCLEPYIKMPVIQSMIQSDKESFGRYNLFLWRVVILKNWLQKFFPESQPHEEVFYERTYSNVPT